MSIAGAFGGGGAGFSGPTPGSFSVPGGIGGDAEAQIAAALSASGISNALGTFGATDTFASTPDFGNIGVDVNVPNFDAEANILDQPSTILPEDSNLEIDLTEEQIKRRKRLSRTGRKQTILTSGLGVLGAPPVLRPTLLGSGGVG